MRTEKRMVSVKRGTATLIKGRMIKERATMLTKKVIKEMVGVEREAVNQENLLQYFMASPEKKTQKNLTNMNGISLLRMPRTGHRPSLSLIGRARPKSAAKEAALI